MSLLFPCRHLIQQDVCVFVVKCRSTSAQQSSLPRSSHSAEPVAIATRRAKTPDASVPGFHGQLFNESRTPWYPLVLEEDEGPARKTLDQKKASTSDSYIMNQSSRTAVQTFDPGQGSRLARRERTPIAQDVAEVAKVLRRWME